MNLNISRRSVAAVASFALVGSLSLSVDAAGAKPMPSKAKGGDAVTTVTVDPSCTTIVIESTKDLSNVVVRTDGEDAKVEFSGSTKIYEVPFDYAITDVWVKSGNNKSGDGPGYGEHHAVTCDDRLDLFGGF